MIQGVQNELNEKNEAIAHLLGNRPSLRTRGPRIKRTSNENNEVESDSDNSEDENKKKSQKQDGKGSRNKKGGNILNIKNGKIKNFKDKDGNINEVDHRRRSMEEFMRDPRYSNFKFS